MFQRSNIQNTPGIGHNSKNSEPQEKTDEMPHSVVTKAIIRGDADDENGHVNKRILSFIERIERLEEEKAALLADIKEIYAEAKGVGFDTKTLRRVVALRKIDAEKRREQEELLDLYKNAIGLI